MVILSFDMFTLISYFFCLNNIMYSFVFMFYNLFFFMWGSCPVLLGCSRIVVPPPAFVSFAETGRLPGGYMGSTYPLLPSPYSLWDPTCHLYMPLIESLCGPNLAIAHAHMGFVWARALLWLHWVVFSCSRQLRGHGICLAPLRRCAQARAIVSPHAKIGAVVTLGGWKTQKLRCVSAVFTGQRGTRMVPWPAPFIVSFLFYLCAIFPPHLSNSRCGWVSVVFIFITFILLSRPCIQIVR